MSAWDREARLAFVRDGGDRGKGRPLRGPRQPTWGCSCGRAAQNWASRVRCAACGADAPASRVKRALAADREAHQKAAVQAVRGGGGRAEGQQGLSAGKELEALRSQLSELQKKFAASQSADVDVEHVEAEREDDPGAANRKAREKIQAEIDRIQPVLGDDSSEVQSRRAQLERLKEQRPVQTRLAAATRQVAKLERASAAAADKVAAHEREIVRIAHLAREEAAALEEAKEVASKAKEELVAANRKRAELCLLPGSDDAMHVEESPDDAALIKRLIGFAVEAVHRKRPRSQAPAEGASGAEVFPEPANAEASGGPPATAGKEGPQAGQLPDDLVEELLAGDVAADLRGALRAGRGRHRSEPYAPAGLG